MNDCVWDAIGVCNKRCKCQQYMSMNSNEGRELLGKWSNKIDEVLKPVRENFAVTNGFKETDNDDRPF